MDVSIRFINRTDDDNNSQFVIFQKNPSSSADDIARAWKVIDTGPQGDEHSFTFPMIYGQTDGKDNLMPPGAGDEGGLPAKAARVMPHQPPASDSKPTIWIGAVSGIEEGDRLDSAIVASINTEISLFGIKSADIVMTGGGPGDAPISFDLKNIVMI